jgi:undecaprenyl-diphosphatase
MPLQHTDVVLAEHANAFALHHDGVEDVARAYAGASELLFLAGVAGLFLAGLLLRRAPWVRAAALSVVAAGVGLAVASVVARVVDRPRPFAADPRIHAFTVHARDPGFPSDHATAAFAIAAVLLLVFGVRALAVLLAAVALAVSRVLIGIHYPGDVVAGALIGSAAAALVVLVSAGWPGSLRSGAARRLPPWPDRRRPRPAPPPPPPAGRR